MAEAKRRDEWDRAAALQALIANTNRDPKKQPRPFTWRQFHPCAGRPRRKRSGATAGVSILKAVFVDRDPAAVTRDMEG